jgi:hypothetical protein
MTRTPLGLERLKPVVLSEMFEGVFEKMCQLDLGLSLASPAFLLEGFERFFEGVVDGFSKVLRKNGVVFDRGRIIFPRQLSNDITEDFRKTSEFVTGAFGAVILRRFR